MQNSDAKNPGHTPAQRPHHSGDARSRRSVGCAPEKNVGRIPKETARKETACENHVGDIRKEKACNTR